jgi:hypothetical protein
MTPTGRRWIIAGTIIVGFTAALLVKSVLSLRPDPSVRRRHSRPTEAAGAEATPIPARASGPTAPTDLAPTSNRNEAPRAPRPTADAPAAANEHALQGADPEFIVTTETPETIASQKATREKLDGAIHRNPGNEVAFLDCTAKPCRARAEAKELETLTAFLRDLSGTYDGHLGVELREHFDPFMGRSFQADLLIGTANTEVVPTEPLVHE